MKYFKKTIFAFILGLTIISCQKIEESVTSVKETAEQKAKDMVKEQVNNQINNVINAENVQFSSIFPHSDSLIISEESGRKINFPSGSPFYLFKYKANDKTILLNQLVQQPSTDEAKSSKEFQKIDGNEILTKLSVIEKFLPESIINQGFINELKTDENTEFYKIKRFPNISTIIYNPKSQTVYQFVEIKK